MDITLTKEKIIKLKKKIETKNSSYKDKTQLDSLHLDSEIIGRQPQAEKILEIMHDQMCSFASVYGRSGSGKSTIVKHLCESLSDSVISLFVNLRKAQTTFGCVNLILSEFGQSQVKSYEGVSKAFEMIQKRIIEICSIQNKDRFILVLDEFDAIFSDKRHSPSDFIFKLLQMVEDLRDQKLFVTILAISNDTISNYNLDDRVKSRMGVFEVYFLPYKKNTILQILSERAKFAFKDKIDNLVLDKCAQINHDETGDCRRAIDLLKLSADIAAGQKITPEHVSEAQKRLNFDRIEYALKNLTTHQRLALAAFAVNVLHTEREVQTTSSLYEQYNSLCAHSKMPALEYRRFSDILSDLQRVGLVLARNRSHGRYGYAKEFEICADYKLVGYRIDPDWWTKTFQQKIDSDRMIEEFEENQRIKRQSR